MSFNLVTMATTRKWVKEMLRVDVNKGDIKLSEDYEKLIQEEQVKDSHHYHQRGIYINLDSGGKNYLNFLIFYLICII